MGEARQLAQYFPLHNLQFVAAQLQVPQLPTKVPPVVLYVVNLREIQILSAARCAQLQLPQLATKVPPFVLNEVILREIQNLFYV